jgi:hypothetical protein
VRGGAELPHRTYRGTRVWGLGKSPRLTQTWGACLGAPGVFGALTITCSV